MRYKFLYSLVQRVFAALLWVIRPFHSKASKIVEGRKRWRTDVAAFRKNFPEEKVFWIHAASVGEFEQALPVIRLLKEANQTQKIAVSFFSPSGMEQKGNHPLVDFCFYLPADTAGNMSQLLSALKPEALVLVKYEFWFNLLNACRQQHIPAISICCILRESSFRNPLLRIHLQHCLPEFRYLFVQNAETARLLRGMGIENFRICGDTRIDRVLEIRDSAQEIDWLPAWKGAHKLLIVGSAWTEDVVFLKEFIRHAVVEADGLWRVLIVPHEVSEAQLQHIESALAFPAVRFSGWKEEDNCDVLLLDATGLLSRSYRYADAAWIGGGFKTGLHNILEAAVYGIPVGFGPKHTKFREAGELIETGLARSFPGAGSVWEFFQQGSDGAEQQQKIRQAAENYFQSQKGAAQLIADFLGSFAHSEKS